MRIQPLLHLLALWVWLRPGALCLASVDANSPLSPATPMTENGDGRYPSPRFEYINLNEGLPPSVVLGILHDRYGFLWIAAQDGLNRYDGYQFKILLDIHMKGVKS